MTSSRIIRCTSCNRLGQHGARGWCTACYQRWRKAGRPDSGPPPAPSREERAAKARAAYQAAAQGRREDYQELRAWGATRQQAAARLGVTERTAWRYEQAQRLRRPAPPRTQP